jgi:hypothetical protein
LIVFLLILGVKAMIEVPLHIQGRDRAIAEALLALGASCLPGPGDVDETHSPVEIGNWRVAYYNPGYVIEARLNGVDVFDLIYDADTMTQSEVESLFESVCQAIREGLEDQDIEQFSVELKLITEEDEDFEKPWDLEARLSEGVESEEAFCDFEALWDESTEFREEVERARNPDEKQVRASALRAAEVWDEWKKPLSLSSENKKEVE